MYVGPEAKRNIGITENQVAQKKIKQNQTSVKKWCLKLAFDKLFKPSWRECCYRYRQYCIKRVRPL